MNHILTHSAHQAKADKLVIQSLFPSELLSDDMNEEAYARDPEPAICDPEQELLLACREVIESWENGDDMHDAVRCCQVAIQLGQCQRTLRG